MSAPTDKTGPKNQQPRKCPFPGYIVKPSRKKDGSTELRVEECSDPNRMGFVITNPDGTVKTLVQLRQDNKSKAQTGQEWNGKKVAIKFGETK